MSVLQSKVFTKELINDVFIVTEEMGVNQISIFNNTAVVATVLGSARLGSYASSAINIEEGETITLKAVDASVIDGLTITSPSGCTLKIVAQ